VLFAYSAPKVPETKAKIFDYLQKALLFDKNGVFFEETLFFPAPFFKKNGVFFGADKNRRLSKKTTFFLKVPLLSKNRRFFEKKRKAF